MKVYTTEGCSPEKAMNIDRQLLQKLEQETLLHLYSWKEPCITYGHFIDIEKHLISLKVPSAKRPTGGGITFHSGDFSFSFFLPSCHRAYTLDPLKNYQQINRTVAIAVQRAFGFDLELFSNSTSLSRSTFCSATPSLYDLFLYQKKVGGAAQRNKKQGYLHQGFLQLFPLCQTQIKDWIGETNPLYEEVMSRSGHLLDTIDKLGAKKKLTSAILESFSSL